MNADILLVDDEVEFTATLRKVLVRRGHTVEVAAGGEAALAALRERAFRVVVLDVKMPGIDGLQVLEEIKRSLPDARVILMTGHLAPGEDERCRAAGAFAYLLKPYPTDTLAALIEATLQASDPELCAKGKGGGQ